MARAQSAIRLHQNRVLVDGFTRSRGSPDGEQKKKKNGRKKPRRGRSGASSAAPVPRIFLPLCPAAWRPWVTWVLRSARAPLRRRPDIEVKPGIKWLKCCCHLIGRGAERVTPSRTGFQRGGGLGARVRACASVRGRARPLSFQGVLSYLITFHIPHQQHISIRLRQINDQF